MNKLKIAIIQEWLVTVGGSDKVVKAILDIYPDADVYTLVSKTETLDELGINVNKVTNSFIHKLPGAKSNHRKYLPLFPFAIEQFDLREYDVVISSSHSVAKGVITSNNQLHICYCHSPMRYAWDLYHQYLEEAGLNKGLKAFLAKYILHRIRVWDLASSFRVDHFLANSNYISKRIHKIYRRESKVIYPNIDLSNFGLNKNKEDFYIACSRLVSYKKIDLIVQAFTKWGKGRLVVIGTGPDYDKINKMKGDNVEMLGFLPFIDLINYMGRAKALIFAADEDFGMIPVEAQATGTPVLGLKKGGTLETIEDGKTGILFDEQTEDSIINAIQKFENEGVEKKPEEIRKWAEQFSEDRFKKEFEMFVNRRYEDFRN